MEFSRFLIIHQIVVTHFDWMDLYTDYDSIFYQCMAEYLNLA